MNIVVTGAFGFLGSNLVKQCAAFGFTPIVLERAGSDPRKLEGVSYISIKYNNIEDGTLIEQIKKYNPQSFVHIAWKGIDATKRDDKEQITYNIPFSIKSMELAHAVNCKQWIGIGSLSEYGKLTEKVDEVHCPDPISLYAKAKLATCWAASALCQTNDMKFSWIRLGSIYGPGDADHWLIPYIIQCFSDGVSPQLTLSKQIWDYLFVTDAADAILNVVKYQLSGIFNLGSGNEIAINKVVELIADKMNATVNPLFGARPYHPDQIMYMVANIDKLTKQTGWKPSVTLSNGIDLTISSKIK